ncbi:MAG: class I SAM-dependent methyltransferase [Myxococcales bacterium]|nr:class I SAM-dependent methyltransferase [Myxococcales bacterium]
MSEGPMQNAREAYEAAMGSRINTPGVVLGPWASDDLINDPKHLAFVMARYKFCAKMLTGKQEVLEVGCGDALGLPIVAQAVGHLHAVDWDPRQLRGNAERLSHIENVSYVLHDLNESPLATRVDAAYTVDVIEHLEPAKEASFVENLVACLKPGGVLITGTPNITAAEYASPQSKIHHINLKSFESLRELMERYFENVFMFGMNDEVLHTGFGPMSHYLWSVAAGPKRI